MKKVTDNIEAEVDENERLNFRHLSDGAEVNIGVREFTGELLRTMLTQKPLVLEQFGVTIEVPHSNLAEFLTNTTELVNDKTKTMEMERAAEHPEVLDDALKRILDPNAGGIPGHFPDTPDDRWPGFAEVDDWNDKLNREDAKGVIFLASGEGEMSMTIKGLSPTEVIEVLNEGIGGVLATMRKLHEGHPHD